MKNYIFLLITSALLLASCGKEKLDESIVGTWNLTNLNVSCPPDVTDIESGDYPATNGCLATDEYDGPCLRLIFGENGMVEILEGDPGELETNDIAPYTVDNENETVTVCFGEEDCIVFNSNDDEISITFLEDGCNLLWTLKK